VSERDETIEAARKLDTDAVEGASRMARYDRTDDRELAAAIDIIVGQRSR